MLQHPHIGKALWHHLCNVLTTAGKEVSFNSLQSLCIDLVRTCLKESKHDQACNFIRCLVKQYSNSNTINKCTNSAKSGNIKELLRDLVNFTAKSEQEENIMEKDTTYIPRLLKCKIYETFWISSQSLPLLSEFCNLEEQSIHDQTKAFLLPPCIQRYSSNKVEWDAFWEDFVTLLWVEREHAFDFVLREGLRLIRDGLFEKASILVIFWLIFGKNTTI